MDGFNKVISFVLGLVVVVVLVAIVSGKLNLKQRFLSVSKGQTTSPTPTLTPTGSLTPTATPAEMTATPTQGRTPPTSREIPKTGSPTELLMLSMGLFATGIMIRKATKISA